MDAGYLADFEEKHPERRTESAEARDCLYAAQCNCPYWHGVFGGLYLPHIRQAVYGKMIDAHSLLRHLAGEKATRIEQLDYDTDGVEEVICDSDDFTAVFKPNRGAMLVDLSLNRYGFDLTDTLSRRKEGYHLKLDQAVSSGSNSDHASIHDLVLAKEEGLAEYLVEDWYLKRCFIDHFFPAGTELEDFGAGNSGEEGDFVLEPYRSEIDKAASRVVFTRHGHIRRPEGVFPAQITKAFVFPARTGAIDVTYELSSSYPGGVDVDFAVENNMNFQAGHAEDRYVLVDSRRPRGAFLDSTDEHFQAHTVALVDQYRLLAAALTSSQPATVWHLPIFTVSLSEGGFERVYQGTTIIHKYRLHLTDRPHRIRFALFAGEMNAVLENAFPMATVGR